LNRFPNYFSKRQCLAIVVLVFFILTLQILFLFWPQKASLLDSRNETLQLSFESEYRILQQQELKNKIPKLRPFNPNFITDYKGYTLGMSLDEIQRLNKFRSGGHWVNSVRDFQKITGISDSLLREISPHFKFPKWVTTSKPLNQFSARYNIKLDLNSASSEALQKVYGIGVKLSERILRYRAQFEGGFADMVELKGVYGLSDEVIQRIKQKFNIKNPRTIQSIDLNTATQEALVRVPFIDYELAYQIIEMRMLKEAYLGVEELTKLKEFPKEKIDIIKLYLHVNKPE
jgi:DNA uptake protein ComE-like DNA-binding protein